MPRTADVIEVVMLDSGLRLDRWSSLSIKNDITSPSEATFELGDDGALSDLAEILAPGALCEVRLNGHSRMRGRCEVIDSSGSASSGSKISLTVRTKMADAAYSSANPKLRIKDASFADVIAEAYAQIGFKREDFVFGKDTIRNVMTGSTPGSKTVPADFEAQAFDKAKVQPPETIREFVERHAKRIHATHWDGPAGQIFVGVPDDTQEPTYRVFCRAGDPSSNVGEFHRIRDWTDVAQTVTAYGHTAGKDALTSKIRATATDAEVDEVAKRTGHFVRSVIVSSNEAKIQEHAQAIADRELSARVRRRDAFTLRTDGWSWFDPARDAQVDWENNTTIDVDLYDSMGQVFGRYLIVRVELNLSVDGGTTSAITCVAPGIWVV